MSHPSDMYEHNPGDHEDPDAGQTWTVGVVGALLMVVIVLGVAALTYNVFTTERDVKVIAEVTNRLPLELEGVRTEQRARLDGAPHFEKRDENKGEPALVIPIRDAMARYLAEASSASTEGPPRSP